ncbi:MAG: response regulator [Rhizomicrobium sp.]
MTGGASIFVVDDDADVRDSICSLLESADYRVESFSSAKMFLSIDIARGACLITDVRMPGMDGIALQAEIARRNIGLPVVVITGHGEVPLAVRAMRAGAIDFLEKPFDGETLLSSVRRALEAGTTTRSHAAEAAAAERLLALLTRRQRTVFDQLVAGHANKVAAYQLGISPRTVEIHRAHIMGKMKARSLSDLIRVSQAASHSSSGQA